MGVLKNIALKAYLRLKSAVNNEKGAQTLEWIAIGAVVVTIAALLQAAFKPEALTGVVDAILDKIKNSVGGSGGTGGSGG